MTSVKECIKALAAHGIDGKERPYLAVIRFHCLHHLPLDEIVLGILVARGMLLLANMFPDGDSLSPDGKARAVALLRQGKSPLEVFKELRPNAKPKQSL